MANPSRPVSYTHLGAHIGGAGTDAEPHRAQAAGDLRSGQQVIVRVHTVYDALAAYTAATRLGLERARAARALASYQTTGMRQNIVQHGGVTFIEDCYNASPDSMKAALQILHDRQPGPGGRRIAVLGDMLELGAASEPGHRQTGKWAADAADLLVAYGPLKMCIRDSSYRCAEGNTHGWLDMAGALNHSCNLYFIQVAEKMCIRDRNKNE